VYLLAVSTGAAIAYAVALWVILVVGPATVTGMKGQWLYLVAGFVTVGIVWWIAAFRLARPGSFWARRFYGPEKMDRAERKYGSRETAPA
jgi:hypothetical protein